MPQLLEAPQLEEEKTDRRTSRSSSLESIRPIIRAERDQMIAEAEARTPEQVEADRRAAELAAREAWKKIDAGFLKPQRTLRALTGGYLRGLAKTFERRRRQRRQSQIEKRGGRTVSRARSSRSSRRSTRASASSGSRGDPDPGGDPDPPGLGRTGRDPEGRFCLGCGLSLDHRGPRAKFCNDAHRKEYVRRGRVPAPPRPDPPPPTPRPVFEARADYLEALEARDALKRCPANQERLAEIETLATLRAAEYRLAKAAVERGAAL